MEFHDDVGLADTVGDAVQFLVEFGMLDLGGLAGFRAFLRIGRSGPNDY